MDIEDLVARRTDLSTFLVHLTRDDGGETAKERLKGILVSGKLRALNPFGHAVKRLQAAKQSTESQNCVCFTETPLEHVHLLTGHIENRKCQFSPYGIAITKKQGRVRGVNPIWYLDMTPGHDWLTNPMNSMIDKAVAAGKYDESDVSKLTPFIEQMGNGSKAEGQGGFRKEFWWEREWRHQGDLHLPSRLIVMCPTADRAEIRKALEAFPEDDRMVTPSYIDATWSLERIIGKLAGIDNDDLGPF